MNTIFKPNSSQEPHSFELNVLVADHDEGLNETISSQIEMLGHAVETAVARTAILQKISESIFDLILLDINYPSCDAIELIDGIREISPNINVVAMAEKTSPEIEKKIRMKRVMYYLIKPFEQGELKAILEHISKREIQLPAITNLQN